MVEVGARRASSPAWGFPSHWRRAPRRALIVALVLLGATLTALCVTLPLERDQGASDWIVHGVALGMTEREVRTYFTEAPHGTWSTALGCSGPALDWSRKDSLTTARFARFEFKNGALVAMRVRGSHEPSGPAAEATGTAVRKQHENAGGSEIAMIDRSCLEHRAEAELIARAAQNRSP